ncbi:NAD-dependent epimerase/dehydratase family protein [Microbacterium suwonense]|uniref:UDP-glucose 4-epimerase-like protein n=1 Tax=Microbacterium suwonense TaxID=683047 RepID=A0ABN6X5C8_9MICO|nr:NAD-dependent epimerase/dehydratase family protein [Microbacterium suwonense]BDZ39228.1 UDP-glucose 4-epimerase-like protein [Microbacterium suwonense]
MKILITGGAGFIGSNLVSHIAERGHGHEVVVLDDLSTGRAENLTGLPARLIVGSLADVGVVRSAAAGADAIVHLGALGSVPRSVKDPVASHVANLTGTLNVLEAARETQAHVVFASSSSVYGANQSLPKCEFDWTRPMSPYAVTKLGAEAYMIAYQYSYDLPTLAFRFFNVYGPKQAADHAYAAVIPRFLDAALSGRALTIHGDGLQSRDFTNVRTVCATLYAALERRVVSPDPVNLAFGTRTPLLDLVSLIETELGHPVAREHVGARVGDVRASQSDGVRIHELFPEITPISLQEGLAETIDWFRQVTKAGNSK